MNYDIAGGEPNLVSGEILALVFILFAVRIRPATPCLICNWVTVSVKQTYLPVLLVIGSFLEYFKGDFIFSNQRQLIHP